MAKIARLYYLLKYDAFDSINNTDVYCAVLQFHKILSKLHGSESAVSWSFLRVIKLNGTQSVTLAEMLCQ